MLEDISHKLRIAISSRALFDLNESNDIFEQQGLEAYSQHQIKHENDALQPGVAFPMLIFSTLGLLKKIKIIKSNTFRNLIAFLSQSKKINNIPFQNIHPGIYKII